MHVSFEVSLLQDMNLLSVITLYISTYKALLISREFSVDKVYLVWLINYSTLLLSSTIQVRSLDLQRLAQDRENSSGTRKYP